MAKVKLTEDLLAPVRGREGTFHLIARAGKLVDEKLLQRYSGSSAKHDAPTSSVTDDADEASRTEPASYDDMRKGALRDLVEQRGLEAKGTNKSDYIEALEEADA